MRAPHRDVGTYTLAVKVTVECTRHRCDGTEYVTHFATDGERHHPAVAEPGRKDPRIVDAVLALYFGQHRFGKFDVSSVGVRPSQTTV